ncbi:MAG TPA: hypothetical protein VNC50_05950 [Planctomycetia bacterium]|nr:hypothetical protein [Planctomycetia bacterium]
MTAIWRCGAAAICAAALLLTTAPSAPAFPRKPSDEDKRAAILTKIAELEADLPRHWGAPGAVVAGGGGGDGNWTPLEVESSFASGGGRFEKLDDGSLFVAGPNPLTDSYTLKIAAPPPRIAALRLAAIPDRRLANGAGRGEGGVFAIGEFRAFAVSGEGAGAKRAAIPFAKAGADFADRTQPASDAIDGAVRTSWSGGRGDSKRRELTLTLREPLTTPEGAVLEIVIDHPPGSRSNLGRFLLLAKSAPAVGPPKTAPATGAATPEERAKLFDNAFGDWKASLKTAPWIVVKPIKAAATPKAKPTIRKDKSTIFIETEQNDVEYEIETIARQPPIVSVRLEVLRDEELPNWGPGRGKPEHANAWTVREFKVFLPNGDQILLATARGSDEAADGAAALAIDGDPLTGWKPSGPPLPCHVAVFDLVKPYGDGRPVKLAFRIATGPMARGETGAPIGRFRISLSSHRLPPAANALPAELEELVQARNRTADAAKKLQRHFSLIAPELAGARERIEALRRQTTSE